MPDLKDTIHTAAWLTVVLSVVVIAFGWFACPIFLRWMNIPDDIMGLSLTYIRIYFLSIFSIVAYNVSAGILHALGNSGSPMIYQLVGGIVNIFANVFFMCVLKFGIAGAALATLLSQTVAAVFTVHHLCKLKEEYRLDIKNICYRPFLIKRIFVIGIPEAIRSMLITFANSILQAEINTLGVDSMAAYAAYCKAEGFLYHPQWAIGITLVISSVVLIFPYETFRLFSNESDIIRLGARIGQTTFGFHFLYAIVEVLSGTICGSGKAMPPMVISLINMCGVRLISLKIALMFIHTVDGIAIVFPITWVTTSLFLIIYYVSGRWKQNNFVDARTEINNKVQQS